jgi:hypothetical protein
MLWTLGLLVIPVLAACLVMFAVCRAAAKPQPEPSLISKGELRSTAALPTVKNRGIPERVGCFLAIARHHRFLVQAEGGYIGLAAQLRKRRK